MGAPTKVQALLNRGMHHPQRELETDTTAPRTIPFAGVVGGAMAGAVAGSMAALPGMVVGAVVGATIGGLAGVAVHRGDAARAHDSAELDAEAEAVDLVDRRVGVLTWAELDHAVNDSHNGSGSADEEAVFRLGELNILRDKLRDTSATPEKHSEYRRLAAERLEVLARDAPAMSRPIRGVARSLVGDLSVLFRHS